jgi:hypothetical protein
MGSLRNADTAISPGVNGQVEDPPPAQATTATTGHATAVTMNTKTKLNMMGLTILDASSFRVVSAVTCVPC